MGQTIEAAYFNRGVEPIVLAADNGGTRTRIELTQGETQLGYVCYDTPTSYLEAMDAYLTTIRNINGGKQVDAIGVAIAGEVQGGTIIRAGVLQERGWCHQPIVEDLNGFTYHTNEGATILGDCKAAGKSQLVENRKSGGTDTGGIFTISTGNGGAKYTVSTNVVEEDEPGHDDYKPGALCGCGKDGCVEAYISGSGIQRNMGIKAEDLSDEQWQTVMQHMVAATGNLINRYASEGFVAEEFRYFGSVALKGRGIPTVGDVPEELKKHPVLSSLREGLIQLDKSDNLAFLPEIRVATNGDDSGIMGARFAAQELLVA